MQSFSKRIISSTSRSFFAARTPRTPRQQPVYRTCSPRYASSSSSAASTSESAQVPAEAQPTTSPDKQQDPLSHPIGSDGTNAGSRDAATVSEKQQQQQEEDAQATDDGHTLMSEQEKEILSKLQKEFPGGAVAVQDVSGGCGTFFAISIESDKFKGLSKIKQHQKVNKILEDEVKTWHGMQLKTMAV